MKTCYAIANLHYGGQTLICKGMLKDCLKRGKIYRDENPKDVVIIQVSDSNNEVVAHLQVWQPKEKTLPREELTGSGTTIVRGADGIDYVCDVDPYTGVTEPR